MIFPLLQESAAAGRPLISWGRVGIEYLGFLAWFAVFGALGFRFVVLAPLERHLGRAGTTDAGTLRIVHDAGLRSAARIGVVGAILLLVGVWNGLAFSARRLHLTRMAALGHQNALFYAGLVAIVVLLVCFLLALGKLRGVWVLAAIAGFVFVFRDLATGRWRGLVNPVHELSASLWLGTLFVLVAAGLPAILRGDVARERRGPIMAELITRFSPLAIGAATVLILSGLTTAWLHLHVLSNLWSTPYGITLIVKLCVVAIVVALGAWNWRGMTPRLGQESAAYAMRRSATTELVVGAIVLACTAVLVSIPSPRPPGARGRPGGPGGPEGPEGGRPPAAAPNAGPAAVAPGGAAKPASAPRG